MNSGLRAADAPVTIDDSPFQNTFVFAANPVVLTASGGEFKETVFDFVVPGGAAAGTYNAQFVLQGGADAYSTTDLTEKPATFKMKVLNAPVPEASTTVALGLLLALGSAAVLRRKKASAVNSDRKRPGRASCASGLFAVFSLTPSAGSADNDQDVKSFC